MIRNVESRLRKLEAVQTPPALRRWHILADTIDGREAQKLMIACGDASEADGFIFLVAAPFPDQFPPANVGGKPVSWSAS